MTSLHFSGVIISVCQVWSGILLFWNTYNRGNTSIENFENIAVNKSQQMAASKPPIHAGRAVHGKIILSTSTGGVLHMYFQSAAV